MPATSWVTIVVLALGFITSLAEVWKDWNERGTRKRTFRWWRLALTILGFPIGILLVYLGNAEALKHDNASKVEIQGLKSAVDTQTKNNETQYVRNQRDLHRVEDQLTGIKSQVASEPLRKKIADLQGELDRALAPAPNAKLQFSFLPLGPNESMRDTTSVPLVNGAVTVAFTAKNVSETQADNGKIWIQICDGCKFGAEPEGSEAPSDDPLTRWKRFDRLFKGVVFEPTTLRVVPPLGASTFTIAFKYACEKCPPIDNEHPQKLRVNIGP
jgi:hypothetical protein